MCDRFLCGSQFFDEDLRVMQSMHQRSSGSSKLHEYSLTQRTILSRAGQNFSRCLRICLGSGSQAPFAALLRIFDMKFSRSEQSVKYAGVESGKSITPVKSNIVVLIVSFSSTTPLFWHKLSNLDLENEEILYSS